MMSKFLLQHSHATHQIPADPIDPSNANPSSVAATTRGAMVSGYLAAAGPSFDIGQDGTLSPGNGAAGGMLPFSSQFTNHYYAAAEAGWNSN
jgi:hypothetical protein